MVDWNSMSVAERIKHARLSMGLSQGKLAELSGLAQSTISYIESGGKKPNIETITILAKALDLPPSYLLDKEQLDNSLTPDMAELVRHASMLSKERVHLLIQLAKGLKDSSARL